MPLTWMCQKSIIYRPIGEVPRIEQDSRLRLRTIDPSSLGFPA